MVAKVGALPIHVCTSLFFEKIRLDVTSFADVAHDLANIIPPTAPMDADVRAVEPSCRSLGPCV
jgi:hypothetical protein